ncbi:MAG: M81 family metallopeptidase, partial [Mesorhizobium sp.]
LYALREKTAMTMLNATDGIDRALAVRAENPGKPVVFADIWDNPGGGVPGDGTFVLRQMLARGLDRFAVATIWDPIAVTFCLAAAKDMLLIKSTNHFYAGFEPIAAEIIYVSAPSSYPSNPAVTDYKKLTRPVWPRVADPWKDAGNLPP